MELEEITKCGSCKFKVSEMRILTMLIIIIIKLLQCSRMNQVKLI